jgi:hypothetical protein
LIRAPVALCLMLLAAANVARAQLIDLDGATRDPSTGLDWLDATATTSLSYDNVIGGAGGWTTRNWRHATLAEACQLFSNHAIAPASPCGTGFASQSGEAVRPLQSLLGLTRVISGQQEDCFGFIDNGGGGPDVGLASLIFSIPATLSLAGVESASAFDRSTALPTHGHLLVRINQAPVSDAGPDDSVLVNEDLALSGMATDPDGDAIVSYLWAVDSQPPGSTPILSDPMAPDSDFRADIEGTYVLSLAASDGFDMGTPDTVAITVGPNLPPTADVSADVTSGVAPLLVTFDGTGSSDPENRPLGYAWDFDDGFEEFFSAVVVHEYTQPGVYQARLRVIDDIGQFDEDIVTITVSGGVPALAPTGRALLATLLAAFGGMRIRRRQARTAERSRVRAPA